MTLKLTLLFSFIPHPHPGLAGPTDPVLTSSNPPPAAEAASASPAATGGVAPPVSLYTPPPMSQSEGVKIFTPSPVVYDGEPGGEPSYQPGMQTMPSAQQYGGMQVGILTP